jgi:hypothetical protein
VDKMSNFQRIQQLSENCVKENGFYPISFSYPSERTHTTNKSKILSSIIPGVPYSYDSYEEYIQNYSNSEIAYTHKKAGWDCFRHLEILYAGAIPLMLDIFDVPQFTMAYYPKDLLETVTSKFLKNKYLPSVSIQNAILDHFNDYLTCSRMVQNILAIIGFAPKTILFLDDSLVERPDYLSMLTLIGLKQNFGSNCVTYNEPSYLYDDFNGSTELLYGKGFGYTRVLNWKLKKSVSRVEPLISFDLIVIGSLARNPELVQMVEDSMVPSIYLFGEDLPPNQAELGMIHNSRAHTFVREIY